MESVIIDQWLKNSGSGYGYGSGDGYGSGYGSGSGDGSGSGSGDGYGSGYGYGYGSCKGSCKGSGYGSGYGSGDGSGSGYGYGYGSGYGYGDGYGSGYGSGYGIRIVIYGNQKVYDIDGIHTIVSSIKGNYAKGSTINLDSFKTNECFIARNEDGTLFSHGDTIRRAYDDLQEKISQSLSEEERIEQFCKSFEKGKKYKCEDFYRWHHLLTGSCEFGRKQFLKEHNIDLDDEFTVDEFIEKTIHDYGSEIIKKLKEAWKKA